jgi:hypothetical protein
VPVDFVTLVVMSQYNQALAQDLFRTQDALFAFLIIE